jgi:TPR repeat protein
MYNRGDGVPQHLVEAAKLFRLAAEQGNTKAQHNLGIFYIDGRGVPVDYTEAIKWLERAANQGQPESQYNLGMIYLNGEGVSRDFRRSMVWFVIAAVNGDKEAQSIVLELRKRRPPDEYRQFEQAANEWLKQHDK